MARRLKVAALLAAGLVVVADQSSKLWALTTLQQVGGHLPLPVPIDFTFNWNRSNAFGLTPVIGGATRWFLSTLNLVVASLLLHAVLTRSLKPLTRFGLALIMAGAFGNGLDRLFYGAVVDFLDATKVGFPWIFNVADATLDVGIGLIMLSVAQGERRTPTGEGA